MKKFITYLISISCMALLLVQCSDWTEMEPKFKEPLNSNDEEYYKALREYKKTDHPIFFGWYSDWSNDRPDMSTMLRGIPDSVDIVSLWGKSFNFSDEQMAEWKEVKEKKGTRFTLCSFATNVGAGYSPKSIQEDTTVNGVKYNSIPEAMAAYWGWYGNAGDTSRAAMESAIRKYARVIVDSIEVYGYDGFDIDYEPHYGASGNLSSYPDRMHIFLDELSKYLGPKSGTGRILIVDGEPQSLNTESGPLLDYYVIQAYDCTGDRVLDGRFQSLLNKFGPLESEAEILSKTVWCENYEKYWNGGPQYTTREGDVIPYSLLGMARYSRPGVDARIGGVGAYRFGLDGMRSGYSHILEVIQDMNPAQK